MGPPREVLQFDEGRHAQKVFWKAKALEILDLDGCVLLTVLT